LKETCDVKIAEEKKKNAKARGGKLYDAEGRCLISELEIADSFFARLKGLLGRKKIADDYGMLLLPCGSVHMFFMKFEIDVFFLAGDKEVFRILEVKRNLKPWRVAFAPSGTTAVLETKPGVLENRGQVLKVERNL